MVFRDPDRLFRHSLLLMVATQVGNAANLLFHMFMMRRLSGVEYGVLAAMLSLVLMLTTPLVALQTAIAHFSARLFRSGHVAEIRMLIFRWGKGVGFVALVIVVTGFLGSDFIARFFQLQSTLIISVVIVVMAVTLFMPLLTGALQGVQSFGWFAISVQSWGVVRLIAALVVVFCVGATAVVGVIAQGVGVLACIALGVCGLTVVLRKGVLSGAGSSDKDTAEPADSIKDKGLVDLAPAQGQDEKVSVDLMYFIKSLLILFVYGVLMNADISLVKHYFNPVDADLFARAATIGRSIIFLPTPIAIAMFPKVVSTGQTSESDRKTLRRSFLYTGVVIIAASLAFTMLARFGWFVFCGQWPDYNSLRLVRTLVWAMAPLGLTFLIMNFELAQYRFRFLWFLVPLAFAYVVLVGVFHDSLWQVVIVMACMNVASMVFLAISIATRHAQSGIHKNAE